MITKEQMTNEELEKIELELNNKTEHTFHEALLAEVIGELINSRHALNKLEEIARIHWDTELKIGDEAPPTETGFAMIRLTLVQLSREYGQIRPLKKVIEEQEEKMRKHFMSGWSDRLRYIFRELEWTAEKSQSAYRSFKEDFLVWTRAIGLAANMAANGGTHREINARMRGLIEMIESAVNAIREAKESERFGFYGANVPDIFRSDYPVREYVHKIHDLERQLKYERKQNGSLPEDETGDEPSF